MSRITLATLRDLDDLITIARSVYSETYDPMGSKPEGSTQAYGLKYFTREAIAPGLSEHPNWAVSPLPIYLIARVQGELAGYSLLEDTPHPIALPDLNSVCFSGGYVGQKFQGHGLGKEFFKIKMKLAQERGYTGAWLRVWNLNEKAVKFHEHMGFKTVGQVDWRFTHGGGVWHCEDLVMVRDLVGE